MNKLMYKDRKKMKITTCLLTAATVLLILAGCQKDDDATSAYDRDPRAVRIHASIASPDGEAVALPQTRVNTYEDGTNFNDNDRIGVCSDNGIAGKNSVFFQLTNNTWLPIEEDNSYLVWGEGENTFQAWYPAAGSASYTSFFILSGQDDPFSLAANDYMTATTRKSQTDDNAIHLEFHHYLSKVTVNIIGYRSEYNPPVSLPDVTVGDFYHPNHFQNETIVQTALGDKHITWDKATSVRSYRTVTDAAKGLYAYTAILAPGTYNEQEVQNYYFFKLQDAMGLNGIFVKPAVSKILYQDGLQPGRTYTFNLVVGKERATIANVEVTDWATGEVLEEVIAKDDGEQFIPKQP